MEKKLINPFTGLQSNSQVLEWVMLVLQENEVDILTADRSALEDKLHLLVKELPRPHFSEKDLQASLNELERAAKEAKLLKLKASVAFKEPNNLLAQYTGCISGNKNKAFEAAKVGHFIWQIKRKLFGLEVFDHMMLILTGPQAGGKSFTVEKQLCSPVKGYVGKHDFSIFDDPFKFPVYERHLVVFFDEMSKKNKAESDSLKFIITTDSLDGRAMYSDKPKEYRQNSTLIGTSNEALAFHLSDSTGNRRFCEIQTLPTEALKNNHPILESIDYVKLWQGINENVSSPIVPFKDDLRREQEQNTPRHHVEDFAEDRLIAGDSFTSNGELNEVYQKWCKDNGIKNPMSRSHLSIKLKESGFKSVREDNVRGFEVQLKQYTTR